MRSAAWGRPGREWPKGESRRRRPGSCELRRERWATPGTGNRAKGFRGAVADQRRRRLSTPGKSERHPYCQRHETPTARGREARSPALIKVAACRSDVHVIPPCRESPRAIDVVRGGIGNPAGSSRWSSVALRTRFATGVRFATLPSLRRSRSAFRERNCVVTVPSPVYFHARPSAHPRNGTLSTWGVRSGTACVRASLAISCRWEVRVAAGERRRHRWMRARCWPPRRGWRG